MIFVGGTHITAIANQKKFQKEQAEKATKVYAQQLHSEVNADNGHDSVAWDALYDQVIGKFDVTFVAMETALAYCAF